jgi:EAL domain-containing protein (putative c-di-GMP-specific phosphodiesterase class I)
MPEMDGLQLLQHVRQFDLDVPVVLITGRPSMETAIRAVEQGALRYLVKPVQLDALVQVLDEAISLHRLARAKREALRLAHVGDRFAGDQAGLRARFARALDGLTCAYQPIASWSHRRVFAYEALMRSSDTMLSTPPSVIDAAERLGRLHDLGRRMREIVVAPLDRLPAGTPLFINLHPVDLTDADLFDRSSPLSLAAERIVLEITERASLDSIPDVRERISTLKRRGFRIALDDLGAGYGGLTSFTALEPNVVKLDIALVRGLPQEPTKQTLVKTMIRMCLDLGVVITAEGIETSTERDALAIAGCDLMQGYLFARPGPPFPQPAF